MTRSLVLLVDDEIPFVETMAKRLTKRGLTVLCANSGEEALRILGSPAAGTKVEAVILDVKMPGMDGLETLVAIKGEHPLVEVVMLTGHATVESAIEGMKLGAFDYLMKPCNLDTLVARIDEAAARKREHEDKIVEAEAQMIVLRRGD